MPGSSSKRSRRQSRKRRESSRSRRRSRESSRSRRRSRESSRSRRRSREPSRSRRRREPTPRRELPSRSREETLLLISAIRRNPALAKSILRKIASEGR